MARWRVSVEIEAEEETREEAVGRVRRLLDQLVALGAIAGFINTARPPRAAPLARRQARAGTQREQIPSTAPVKCSCG